jgi:ATP-dependent protease HslVU (ClpYQ) peptidase subunit
MFACLVLTGCAREVKDGGAMSGISGPYDNPMTWLRAAKAHEAQGDLQRALLEYRLAKTVSLSKGHVEGQIQRLEREIEKRAAGLLRKAEAAADRGHRKQARALYLELLALQPDHRVALAALREQDQKYALNGLQRKRELARQNLRNGRPAGTQGEYDDESYAYSRQAILDAAEQTADAGYLFQELARHLEKYPNDKELRRLLIETSLGQAKQAYQLRQLDQALVHLTTAEQASRGDAGYQETIGKMRRQYARELYKQGVISFRSAPEEALSYWRYALKFDPQDERSRLRIRSLSQR